MPPTVFDLEIALTRRDAASFGDADAAYGIELRFNDPASEADQRTTGAAAVRFDRETLRGFSLDPAAYGAYLAEQLLAGQDVHTFFDRAVAAAERANAALRLRLDIKPNAAELHTLRWETLRLPGAVAPLLAGQNVTFARYLSSLDWRPVRLRPEAELRALVAVADPADVAKYRLAPVERDKELAAARAGLGDIAITELATRGQVTLDAIAEKLRDGCDILYLVAHGRLIDGEPWLFLEDAAGNVARVPGRELVARIQGLADRPRLAVLVSCQSAGTGAAAPAGDDPELVALGPRLAEAGVPAVIAMQGNVTMTTAADFMAAFFRELRRDGLVDRAMAVARGTVRDRPDWWMPVLFSRLKSGRIWGSTDDPLFGLPPLPPLDMPDKPYRYLDWYRREDAWIFFGRNREIRALYDRATATDGPPIILFYGQSGVGKSSLLAAGLEPRLEDSHEVRYARRDQARGLAGTLAVALGTDPGADLSSAWRELESQAGRPLLVILDQVEELFTRPNREQPDEMSAFLAAAAAIFGKTGQRPHGKLILSFRKEWLAEIKERLAERSLPLTEVFLQRLGREGIIEVVTGPGRTQRLRDQYRLTIGDPLLPGLVADDLLADRESPVAPMLAILLTDMWDAAKVRSYDRPTFDTNLYHEFRSRGLSLDDFLGRQLQALHGKLPEAVDSGLALDLLAHHTTPLGTAEQRTLADLEQTYRHRQDVLPALLQECRDLYLLVDPAQNQPDKPPASRLTHDTLAPHVRKRFDESDAPGQRARRILESRAVDWENSENGAPLDESDLAPVTEGIDGMRTIRDAENRLLRASRYESIRRAKHARRVRFAFIGAVLLILASLSTALLLAQNELRKTRSLQLYQEAMRLKEDGEVEAAIAALKQAAAMDQTQGINMVLEEAKIRREIASKWVREGERSARAGESDRMTERFEAALALDPPLDTPIYVWVESGEFIMGSDPDDEFAAESEMPKRRVFLDGYWISRTEITNAQYRECMLAGVCNEPFDNRYLEAQYASNPVTGITLDEARTYAQWVGGRLPTEMEWEKACRGPSGQVFPWGDAEPDPRRLNYGETRIFSWLSVGSFADDMSPYGVLDMAGNVAEWTDSKFRPGTQDDLYVTRGGSYGMYDIGAIRCANRRTTKASAPDVHAGLRVVITP